MCYKIYDAVPNQIYYSQTAHHLDSTLNEYTSSVGDSSSFFN